MADTSAQRIKLAGGQWLAIGRDQWLMWHHPSVEADVRLRAEVSGDTWRIAAVHVERADQESVQASDLRLLAFGEIEAALKGDDAISFLANPCSDLVDLAPTAASTADARAWAESLPVPEPPPIDLTLDIPPKGQRDDEFYSHVKWTVAWGRLQDRSGARAVAEANGVPVSTIYGWVKEAKRREESRRQVGLRMDEILWGLAELEMTWSDYREKYEGQDDPLDIFNGGTTADIPEPEDWPPTDDDIRERIYTLREQNLGDSLPF